MKECCKSEVERVLRRFTRLAHEMDVRREKWAGNMIRESVRAARCRVSPTVVQCWHKIDRPESMGCECTRCPHANRHLRRADCHSTGDCKCETVSGVVPRPKKKRLPKGACVSADGKFATPNIGTWIDQN